MRRSVPFLLVVGLWACNPPVDTGTHDTSTTDTSTTDTSTTDTGTNGATVEDCGSITPDQSVSLHNIAYDPSSLTISAGQTVEWTNNDSVTHTVTSGDPTNGPDGKFDSGNMSAGATFCVKFANAGSFPYYCKIHLSAMTGSLTVQ